MHSDRHGQNRKQDFVEDLNLRNERFFAGAEKPLEEKAPRTESADPTPTAHKPISQLSKGEPMSFLDRTLRDAEHSAFARFKLNLGVRFMVPFNSAHRIKVSSITESEVRAELPYRRSNFNHRKTLHACALATVAEFSSGIMLYKYLSFAHHSILMKTLQTEYHAPGKSKAFGICSLSREWFDKEVAPQLESVGKLVIPVKARVEDEHGTLLMSADIHWAIKDMRRK